MTSKAGWELEQHELTKKSYNERTDNTLCLPCLYPLNFCSDLLPGTISSCLTQLQDRCIISDRLTCQGLRETTTKVITSSEIFFTGIFSSVTSSDVILSVFWKSNFFFSPRPSRNRQNSKQMSSFISFLFQSFYTSTVSYKQRSTIYT